MKVIVGTASVRCPQCGEDIPVQVDFQLVNTAEDGSQYARAEPDLAEVWAHAWTHEPRGVI